MNNYKIYTYQPGFDAEQAQIGIQVALEWTWPFAYDLDDLLKIHSQPEFDPETHLYCFLENEMVGYLTLTPLSTTETEGAILSINFPRMKSGIKTVAPLLMEKALEFARKKGFRKVVGRVSSMNPIEIHWVEQAGFKLYDWGHKVYYQYELAHGKINLTNDLVEPINPECDLEEIAELASHWYKQPPNWCLQKLQDWHQYGVIAHTGIRSNGKWVASCLTARNVLRHETAANYYIYTPDKESLSLLLSTTISHCYDQTINDLIADLINEHREFEPVYQKLGFRKVADWAKCELDL